MRWVIALVIASACDAPTPTRAASEVAA